MKVQNIMSANVASCGPDTNLAAAAGLLWEHDCGSLPVVDGQGKAVGVVTDRDLCPWPPRRKTGPPRRSLCAR